MLFLMEAKQMTIKDWLYLAITICFYGVTYVAYIYTKSKAKINKATTLGKIQDIMGKKAECAVHLAEDAGLDSNDDKHQFAKDLLIQWSHTLGLNLTSQELDGLIKVAVSAMHLAWAESDAESDDNNEISEDVPAKDVIKPETAERTVSTTETEGDKNA